MLVKTQFTIEETPEFTTIERNKSNGYSIVPSQKMFERAIELCLLITKTDNLQHYLVTEISSDVFKSPSSFNNFMGIIMVYDIGVAIPREEAKEKIVHQIAMEYV